MNAILALIGGGRGLIAAGAGALIAGTLAYNVGHWRGDNAGYERAQAENLQATIDQIKERQETDAEIRDLDDTELCELLGGSMSDGRCQ